MSRHHSPARTCRGLACTGASLAVLAAIGLGPAVATTATAATAHAQATAPKTETPEFTGIAVVPRSTQAWAVTNSVVVSSGAITSAVWHRVHGVWHQARLDAPRSVVLNTVSASSPTTVWVAGFRPVTGQNGYAQFPVAYRLLGGEFRSEHVPDAGPAGFKEAPGNIASISVSSPTNAWLTGIAQIGSDGPPFTAHWNGRRWQYVRADDATISISTSSRRNAWTFVQRQPGTWAILRDRGTAWKQVKTVSASGLVLTAVATSGPHRTWIVGARQIQVGQNVVSRPYAISWNGRRWSRAALPMHPTANQSTSLLAVAATGSSAYAVGQRVSQSTGDGAAVALAFRNGRWHRLQVPEPSDDVRAVTVGASSRMALGAGYFAATSSHRLHRYVARLH